MNANKVESQAAAKKHLASYSIWYRVGLGITALTAVYYLVLLVGWFTGHTLELYYGIDGLLHSIAVENPYIILYMNYFGMGVCVLMALYAGYNLYDARFDKEASFDKLRSLMIFNIVATWAVPLYNALADLVYVTLRIRAISSYDLFDLGMTAWPMIIVTALSVVVILVNGHLGVVPASEEIE